MDKTLKHRMISLLFSLLLAGCGMAGTAKPTLPVALPRPLPTLGPTRTKAATWTRLSQFITPAASATAARVERDITVIPTAAVPLVEKGPWLMAYSEAAVWAANPDGTGLTLLTDSRSHFGNVVTRIAPHGGRLVFFYPPMIPPDIAYAPPDLTVVSLPSLSQRVLPRYNGSIKPTPSTPGPDPYGEIFAALVRSGSVVWSPDGTTLAFASARDGPSVDLYTYSTLTGAVKRLTDGPTQTIDISWSPGGNTILSSGARTLKFGVGGDTGPVLDSIWAVRPDGSGLRQVQTFPGGSDTSPILLDWVNDHAYVGYYSALGCPLNGLTFVDIQTSKQYTPVRGAMGSLALDPVTGTAFVTIPTITEEYAYLKDCGTTPGPGMYLVSVYGSKPLKRIALDTPSTADVFSPFARWSPEAKLFFLFSSNGIFTIDLQGQAALTDIPDHYNGPASSPNGREWAIFDNDGLWIASPDHPTQQVFAGPVDSVLWAPDGRGVLFASNRVIYRAEVGDYKPIQLAGPIPTIGSGYDDALQLSWVMP